MVFERRPDELFLDAVERGLGVFKATIEGVTEVIRTGDSAISELDEALTGYRPKFGETPQETFSTILEMLEGTLLEAKERGSASAPSVVQHARQILSRINAVEPAWRPGPMGLRTTADVCRIALRDLRASGALIRLAQGLGSLEDLEALMKWAEDLSARIESLRAGTSPQITVETPQQLTMGAQKGAGKSQGKKGKRDTTPKTKPEPGDVAFAMAVAEELGDEKVKGWAKEFSDGKISEAQWISRLTNHAAATRNTLDDIFDRATKRLQGQGNVQTE